MGAKLGVAFPHPEESRWVVLWDLIGAGYECVQKRGGPFVETTILGMVGRRGIPVSSGPFLLAEGGPGRRWGRGGLSTYLVGGVGLGYTIHGHIPYVEYRRRRAIHSTLHDDQQVLIGLKFELFD